MTPQERLRYHVTGAIERGEAQPIIEQPTKAQAQRMGKTEQKHAESGCTDYLQHPWQSCPENKAQAQHSPLPWALEWDNEQPVITSEARDIATLETYYEDAEANAQLIVASVNHADKLAEALRECITEQGAMSERSHYNAKRRLQYITDTARLALAAYEAAQ